MARNAWDAAVDQAVQRLLQHALDPSFIAEARQLRAENAQLKASLHATQSIDDAEISRLWNTIEELEVKLAVVRNDSGRQQEQEGLPGSLAGGEDGILAALPGTEQPPQQQGQPIVASIGAGDDAGAAQQAPPWAAQLSGLGLQVVELSQQVEALESHLQQLLRSGMGPPGSQQPQRAQQAQEQPQQSQQQQRRRQRGGWPQCEAGQLGGGCSEPGQLGGGGGLLLPGWADLRGEIDSSIRQQLQQVLMPQLRDEIRTALADRARPALVPALVPALPPKLQQLGGSSSGLAVQRSLGAQPPLPGQPQPPAQQLLQAHGMEESAPSSRGAQKPRVDLPPRASPAAAAPTGSTGREGHQPPLHTQARQQEEGKGKEHSGGLSDPANVVFSFRAAVPLRFPGSVFDAQPESLGREPPSLAAAAQREARKRPREQEEQLVLRAAEQQKQKQKQVGGSVCAGGASAQPRTESRSATHVEQQPEKRQRSEQPQQQRQGEGKAAAAREQSLLESQASEQPHQKRQCAEPLHLQPELQPQPEGKHVAGMGQQQQQHFQFKFKVPQQQAQAQAQTQQQQQQPRPQAQQQQQHLQFKFKIPQQQQAQAQAQTQQQAQQAQQRIEATQLGFPAWLAAKPRPAPPLTTQGAAAPAPATDSSRPAGPPPQQQRVQPTAAAAPAAPALPASSQRPAGAAPAGVAGKAQGGAHHLATSAAKVPVAPARTGPPALPGRPADAAPASAVPAATAAAVAQARRLPGAISVQPPPLAPSPQGPPRTAQGIALADAAGTQVPAPGAAGTAAVVGTPSRGEDLEEGELVEEERENFQQRRQQQQLEQGVQRLGSQQQQGRGQRGHLQQQRIKQQSHLSLEEICTSGFMLGKILPSLPPGEIQALPLVCPPCGITLPSHPEYLRHMSDPAHLAHTDFVKKGLAGIQRRGNTKKQMAAVNQVRGQRYYCHACQRAIPCDGFLSHLLSQSHRDKAQQMLGRTAMDALAPGAAGQQSAPSMPGVSAGAAAGGGRGTPGMAATSAAAGAPAPAGAGASTQGTTAASGAAISAGQPQARGAPAASWGGVQLPPASRPPAAVAAASQHVPAAAAALPAAVAAMPATAPTGGPFAFNAAPSSSGGIWGLQPLGQVQGLPPLQQQQQGYSQLPASAPIDYADPNFMPGSVPPGATEAALDAMTRVCPPCDRLFDNQAAYLQHMADPAHLQRVKRVMEATLGKSQQTVYGKTLLAAVQSVRARHFPCFLCRRTLPYSNFLAHLLSTKHARALTHQQPNPLTQGPQAAAQQKRQQWHQAPRQ